MSLMNKPTVSHADTTYIGEQARELGEYRRQADYGEFIYDLSHFVADAIANAEDLKERLEALPRRTA